MKSKNYGAIAIVAGTSIGAGMLGLPMTIGSLGFWAGVTVLLCMWLVAIYSALLLLEINLEFGKGKNLSYMTRQVLGVPGQLVGTGCVFFLLYSLLVAYLNGVGGIISSAVGVAPQAGTIAFAVVSAVLLWSGTHRVVWANKILLSAMLVAMIVSFFVLNGQLNLDNLQLGTPSVKGMFLTLPVFVTSFGYHTCLPSVVSYVGEDKKSLIRIVLIGSTIPTVCYFFWILLALGSTTPENLAGMHGVEALVAAISGGSSLAWTIISLFAALALVTSFFGVALGLFDLVAETFKRSDSSGGRAQTIILVFLPPLIASLLVPDNFIKALSHAGAALTVIAVLLPCVMAWKMRAAGRNNQYRAVGGRPALLLGFLCGICIITANYVTL